VTERSRPRSTDCRAQARGSGKPGAAASFDSRDHSTRYETSKESADLARGGPSTKVLEKASPRSSGRGPPWAAVVKDAGGAGRRREGARARRSVPKGAGLAAGGTSVANAQSAGSPPDGGHAGSIDRACRRILGSRAQASEFGSRKTCARRLDSRKLVRSGTRSSTERVDARDRTRNPKGLAGENSRGEKAQESTGQAAFTPAGV
jgi:hypothetical protein